MKNGKHTPGPWDCKKYADGTVFVGMPRSPDTDHDHPLANQIAEICGDITLPITRANAKLITAAPDLLEACECALDALDYLAGSDEALSQKEMLKNVITKAKGDSNAS